MRLSTHRLRTLYPFQKRQIYFYLFTVSCAVFALAFFDSNEKAKDIFTAQQQQQQHTK